MPAPFDEYAFFFPFYIFGFFVQTRVFVVVWIDIRDFDWISLVLLSFSKPISSCFHYWSSVVEFEVWVCDTFRSSFVVQDCFGYPWYCWTECGLRGMLLCIWQECKHVHSLWKSEWGFFRKLGNDLPQDPVIPLLGIYPTDKDMRSTMFIATSFVIART